MDYLPVFLNITDQVCLVVGGSDVAYRKCRFLVKAGARIRLVGLEIDESLKAFLEQHSCSWQERAYESSDLDGCVLVVASTCVEEVNRQIHADAVKRNLPVNVVDQPDLCTFIFPSVIDRNPITVAISSGGQSPVLARLLRARLETLIPANYGKLTAMAGKFRDKVKQAYETVNERRYFWEKVLQGPVAELVFNNRQAEAEQLFEATLANESGKPVIGEVYLVGAGPGDPDLLTFKALRLMQQADVVLYDRLVSEPILELVRKDATMMYVGKQKSDHAVPQDQINQTLVDYAKQGLRVLRLKGGDPFIFGRGGEEMETLAAQGVNFQVVPGITAASGCAAYAGIPLTHRDHALSVRFLTGHMKDGYIDMNWAELMDPGQTLVFYMGLTGTSHICEQLISHGRAADTPVAVIEKGTTNEQRVIVSTLEQLPELIVSCAVKAPSLTIVGQVVTLHKTLDWFQTQSDSTSG